jgi:hypothetical protein
MPCQPNPERTVNKPGRKNEKRSVEETWEEMPEQKWKKCPAAIFGGAEAYFSRKRRLRREKRVPRGGKFQQKAKITKAKRAIDRE